MLCQAFLSLLGCCLGQPQGYWYPGYSHLPTAAYTHPYQHYAGYSHAPAPAPAPAPVYSQSLAQAHEMSLGAHNVYHLVRPDHLQNIPSGDYLNMFKYF